MKQQNAKLKKEFAELKEKLEECIDKAKRGAKPPSDKPAPSEEEMSILRPLVNDSYDSEGTRDQEHRTEGGLLQEADPDHEAAARGLLQHRQVRFRLAISVCRIVALENEEKAKKKIIQELEGEKHSLLRIQKEQKKAMDVMINEKELKKKRDQLKEELRTKKNEMKEKQNLLRKQEKQMKEQHEGLIVLEEKCRKLQTLINEKKAGLNPAGTEAKTEEDVHALEAEIKDLEHVHNDEKKKYKQMITTQETKIKELTLQIETLNLELKQKDQASSISITAS